MTSLIHPCQKKPLIPLKFEVVFNYDTFFKVAQSYPYGPKLAQLTVPALRLSLFIYLFLNNRRRDDPLRDEVTVYKTSHSHSPGPKVSSGNR